MKRSTRTVPGMHTRERSFRPRSTSMTCSARSFWEASSASSSPSQLVPAIGFTAARVPSHFTTVSGDELRRVAGEDFRDALRVVEADERLDNDEPALGESRPLVGERHGRLELRDEVVAEVADDRDVEAFDLLEGQHTAAGAHERVAAEPAALDRLQQEARAPGAAQAQVRAERGDQVGCDLGRGDDAPGQAK